VAALLAAVVLADEVSFKFESKNLTDAGTNFSFRYQHKALVDIPSLPVIVQLPKKALLWASASVSADKATANANGIVAAAIPSGLKFFPMTVLGYAKGEASAKFDASKIMEKIFSSDFSATFKGGMVGMAALSLEELTPDNQPVQGTYTPLVAPSANKVCDPKKIDKDGVYGMSCKVDYDMATVIISFLTSEKAGILDYGETPVSPRTVEMTIEVQNFKLTDNKNHVRLNLGFVSGEGSGNVKGNAKVISKDGESVYVAASASAVIEKKLVDVKVNVNGDFGNYTNLLQNFDVIMKFTLGAKYDAHVAHIDFPAGEKSFVYDPAAGTGAVIYDATKEPSSACTASLSLLLLVICTILFFF